MKTSLQWALTKNRCKNELNVITHSLNLTLWSYNFTSLCRISNWLATVPFSFNLFIFWVVRVSCIFCKLLVRVLIILWSTIQLIKKLFVVKKFDLQLYILNSCCNLKFMFERVSYVRCNILYLHKLCEMSLTKTHQKKIWHLAP
jgi:hypothetical protein